VSARAKRRESDGEGGLPWVAITVVAGILATITFLIGFGVTALAFTGGSVQEVVTVPDVRDLTVEEAARTMRRFELTIEIGDSFPNPEVAAGSVLTQSPLPGREVSPGTEVRLIVSTGRLRPTVPDLEGMPAAIAVRSLQASGFEVLIEDAPGEGAEGRVVGTVPEAGSIVQIPAVVRLRIAVAQEEVEMPVLLGLGEEAARASVDGVGLVVTEIDYVAGPGSSGDVVGQTPAPGDSVPLGGGVRLQVVGQSQSQLREEAQPTTASSTPFMSMDRGGVR